MWKLYIMKEKEELLKNYNFPEKPSSDGYYHIYVKDSSKKNGRRSVKDKTLSGLQEKIILFEKGATGSAKKTFHDIFEIFRKKN